MLYVEGLKGKKTSIKSKFRHVKGKEVKVGMGKTKRSFIK